jgi:GNAT superfamily N-acetyltransferase
MSNRIRIFETSDAAAALTLSRAVGWNQTLEEWALAIEMNPMGCFALESEGMVVATTTTIRYGTDLAWIGMVLTHPEFRGRGFARSLMECAVDYLSDVETIKLDATEMGAPLYRKLGFVDECAIERWSGSAPFSSVAVNEFTARLELDRIAFGADRSRLLDRLAQIEAASVGEAFAMGRGNRFGPCVSRSREDAWKLAQWYLARHPNETIIWDLFPENNLAQFFGFECARPLTRMVRGRKRTEDKSLIYAGAGFEFG